MDWKWDNGDYVLEDADGSMLAFLRESDGKWEISMATQDGEGNHNVVATKRDFEAAIAYVEARV